MALIGFKCVWRSILGLAVAAVILGCSSSSTTPTSSPTTERYVGTMDGTNVLVGLVVTDDTALLFFCGAGATLTTLTHWMRGPATLGKWPVRNPP